MITDNYKDFGRDRIKEDGQSEKLEEKRIKVKKGFKPLFNKDVNDPSERGHD